MGYLMQELAVNTDLIQDLYRRFAANPADVDRSWHSYFAGIDVKQGSWIKVAVPPKGIDAQRTLLMLGRLIENYRWRGHLRARLDPLGLREPLGDADLTLDAMGLELGDAGVQPDLMGELGMVAGALQAILGRLEEIYCGSVGFEFMLVPDPRAREWLRDAIETGWGRPDLEARRAAAKRLVEAEELEHFMHRRYPGKKRFGAEGAESLIAWLGAALDHAAALGAETVIMGGTSRARLNQMANIVGKPLGRLFAEFYGATPFVAQRRISGDVAYHLGYVSERQFGGRQLRVDYCYNPSHLEAVDAVAIGRACALQAAHGRHAESRKAIWPVLVHTDSAFAGQGVVAETWRQNEGGRWSL